jgi:hypothetical protein
MTAGNESAGQTVETDAVAEPRIWTAQALRERVERMIERELARCERTMTPDEWCRDREWITENVVTAASKWLRDKSSRGEL